MTPNELTLAASRAGDRYNALLLTLRSVWERAARSRGNQAREARSMVSGAYSAAQSYLETETDMIASASERVVDQALADFAAHTGSRKEERPSIIKDHAEITSDFLRNQLAAQIERDIITLRSSLQRTRLSAMIREQAGMPPAPQGSMGERFYFHDSLGRKIAASRHIRQVWRHHLLLLYVETYLFTAAAHGFETVILEHSNPRAEVNGRTVTIMDGFDTSYSSIKDQVFHPNAEVLPRVQTDVPS